MACAMPVFDIFSFFCCFLADCIQALKITKVQKAEAPLGLDVHLSTLCSDGYFHPDAANPDRGDELRGVLQEPALEERDLDEEAAGEL